MFKLLLSQLQFTQQRRLYENAKDFMETYLFHNSFHCYDLIAYL